MILLSGRIAHIVLTACVSKDLGTLRSPHSHRHRHRHCRPRQCVIITVGQYDIRHPVSLTDWQAYAPGRQIDRNIDRNINIYLV